MRGEALSAAAMEKLLHLNPGRPSIIVPQSGIEAKRIIPRRGPLTWRPTLCLAEGKKYHVVQEIGTPDIPRWLDDRLEALQKKPKSILCSLLINTLDSYAAMDLAGKLLQRCITRGIGLIVNCKDDIFQVLPPAAKPKEPHQPVRLENGHIPSWVLDELSREESFSPAFKRALDRFLTRYEHITRRRGPSFNSEADVLFDFARRLVTLEPRLFIPVDRLHILKEWERTSAPAGHRDHFFHTFNNLFLGYLILGRTLVGRKSDEMPDRFIRDRHKPSKINPWEALWLLTCLFHDPGYVAEKFGATVAFDFGLSNQTAPANHLPPDLAIQVENAWETSFSESGGDLLELYERLTGDWTPGPFKKGALTQSFFKALREAYLDGKRLGHSVVSALVLMHACSSDKAKPSSKFDKKKAWTACVIAALGMMFHDQKCRTVFSKYDVKPLSFEQLPYAATLIYVDALQEDRRSISENAFPRHGVLQGIQVFKDNDPPTVRAEICLPELPLEKWPGKIMEFESVMRWINQNSKMRFEIDYQTQAWRVRQK